MRPIRIFTIVWGGHIDWMYHALVRSLTWPRNKAALQNAKWVIYGPMEEQQRIYEIATLLLPCHQIQLRPLRFAAGGGLRNGQATHVDLLACMLDTMRMCLDDKIPMLTAPPDTIFADGTIDALLAYGGQHASCVAIPHPRCQPSIMNELTEVPPRNSQLVTWALEKHRHEAWRTSEYDMPISGVNVGGICWQKVSDKVYAVQHRLPTVYLSNFIEDDRKFFSRSWKGVPQQYGMWDHEWPGAQLIGPEESPSQRMRTISSSDLAFVVECTEPWKNTPTQKLIHPDNKDGFHRDEYHNKVNRQYFACFRGE